MKDLTGATLGKYQVLERLGRGGMADVYRAYQPGMDRYVAIKVLHGHLSEDTGFIARFKREAQSVGTLRHPNIVQVIDFDAVDDDYYMVMEFIDGDTLKALLTQRGALPVAEAIALMVKIADAVAYAHHAGMIHRDIKPANIMMTGAGEPILTDFGIAKILSATNLTATGVAIGTPAYMSPEAGRGEKVDERADIYSLGIMFYEMVTGAVPFDADTPWAVILKHINEPLPRPTAVLPTLPQSVERVILKALTKMPDERFQTATDFREALVKAGQTLADPPTTIKAASDSPSTQVARKTEAAALTAARPKTGRLVFGALTLIFVLGAGAFYIANQPVISNSPAAQTSTAVALLPTTTLTVTASSTSAPTETVVATETETTVPSAEPTETTVPTSTATLAPTETTAPSAIPTILPTDAPTSAPTQIAAALNTDSQYKELAQQIILFMRDGRLDDALTALAKPLADDPQNYLLQQLKAVVLVQYRDDPNKMEQGKALAEAGVTAYPDRPEAYFVLAQYWGMSPQDDYQKALELVTQAINKGMTTYADVYVFHGTMLYYLGGSPDDILVDLGKAIALEPNNEALYRRRGFYYLNDLYRLPEAQGDFEKAIALEHGNIFEISASLAWIYIKLDKPDEAFELYRKPIAEDVISNPSYLADAALIAWQTAHIPEAEKWATDAKAIDPSSNVAKYAVALVAWAKEDRVNALKYLDEIASSPDPDTYHYSFLLQWYRLGRELEMDRAYILIELDRKDEAIDALKVAVEKYNNWIDPYLQLSKLYTEKQDKQAAREILQRALEMATNQQDAEAREQVLSMLKELGD